MTCLFDGEREGSNVPVHMNFLVVSEVLTDYGWARLVVGERETDGRWWRFKVDKPICFWQKYLLM